MAVSDGLYLSSSGTILKLHLFAAHIQVGRVELIGRQQHAIERILAVLGRPPDSGPE